MNQTRRQILKILAAAPLILPLGLTASPIMRYLKPTMKPLGFFDPPDLSGCDEEIHFNQSDFPVPWTCIPFMFPMKFLEFNPEKQVVREIPAFILRLSNNEIVAFSRICPYRGCILNYVPNPRAFNCGCGTKIKRCCCAVDALNPVMECPCDLSVFDLANEGRVIRGPAPRPARMFDLHRRKDKIAIVRLDYPVISGT